MQNEKKSKGGKYAEIEGKGGRERERGKKEDE